MCLICVEFQKEKLTIEEAFSNLDEMSKSIGEEHYQEVLSMLSDAMYEAAKEPVMNINLLGDPEEDLSLMLDQAEWSGGLFWDRYLNDYIFEMDDLNVERGTD